MSILYKLHLSEIKKGGIFHLFLFCKVFFCMAFQLNQLLKIVQGTIKFRHTASACV